MVYNFFGKKLKESGMKSKAAVTYAATHGDTADTVTSNQQLADELHKQNIIKFKKC